MGINEIDFVVLWVDCNDPKWQKERSKYSLDEGCDNSTVRYQDWENFRFWFRGVAQNAPWVRKIHLVTNGQVPQWLDTECPKIHLVKHEDYMDSSMLPTFNSSAIELGIYKIQGLADQFVYFNDDMFLMSAVKPEYFFVDNIPVDMAGFIRRPKKIEGNVFSALLENNARIIYRHFSKNEVVWKNLRKWFRLWYGKTFLRSVLYALKREAPGFVIPHLSTAYLKDDFEKVWMQEREVLQETQHHRFRSTKDVNHFLFRNWRMSEGAFVPRKSRGKYFGIKNEKTARSVAKTIIAGDCSEICINETCTGEEFEKVKKIINSALMQRFPEKSIFEK